MCVLHHVQQGNILCVYLPAAYGVARGKQVFLEIEQVGHVVGQQAEAIDHEDPAAGFRLGQAVIDHQRHNFSAIPHPAEPLPRKTTR